MRQFIVEILVTLIILVLLGCIFCIPGYGQDWQDEQHVWNEEKGEWEVENRAGGRVTNTDSRTQSNENVRNRPFEGEPWGKYLPKNVRYGKRPPTEWELKEAQRKLWANHIIKQRAYQKAQARRELIAYRKATGWYAARRNAGLQQGASAYNMHMQTVSAGMNNMRYGNVHHNASCAPSRFGQNVGHGYGKPNYNYTQPRIYQPPAPRYQYPPQQQPTANIPY
jgi:hypothetical protein